MTATFTHQLRDELSCGTGLDSALMILREQGATIIDSIKAVREVRSILLGDAKRLVSQSTAWDDIRESHAQFVDEIVQSLNSVD